MSEKKEWSWRRKKDDFTYSANPENYNKEFNTIMLIKKLYKLSNYYLNTIYYLNAVEK
jgi:hypothetical protein